MKTTAFEAAAFANFAMRAKTPLFGHRWEACGESARLIRKALAFVNQEIAVRRAKSEWRSRASKSRRNRAAPTRGVPCQSPPEHLKGKPWEDGVDNGLRSLACKLRENGMWDCPITQEWFSALCVEKGHVKQKDIDRVSRPMKAH